MQRLVLIDGNAIFHRGYHAMPNFTTSKGELVGAIFGFTSMLLKIYQDLKPTHLIAAFDTPAANFRHELYVGYQEHRPSLGVDLTSQFEGAYKIVAAFGIPLFKVDGYEADDVIGTLARQAIQKTEDRRQKTDSRKTDKRKNQPSVQSAISPQSSVLCPLQVIIVTGDKDLMQLINECVKVYTPIKGLTEAKMYGIEEVKERFGLEPHQMIDMKALMGDPSDGYPGVNGIGPKTASTLLQKYHTLENIYKHLGELPKRQAELLAYGAESAGLAQKLATIVTDVPIQLDLDACRCILKKNQQIIDTLRSFEFKTLTNRYLELIGEKPLTHEESTLRIAKQKEKKKPSSSDDDQLSLL